MKGGSLFTIIHFLAKSLEHEKPKNKDDKNINNVTKVYVSFCISLFLKKKIGAIYFER